MKPEKSPESAQPSPMLELVIPVTLPALPVSEEIGGPPGPEPTRYGDWERRGRCIDF